MTRPRRKRVQVGWYCDHRDEMSPDNEYKGSHQSHHGKYKRGKWVETFPEPCVNRSLSFLDWKEPKKPPHCARAVPVYIYEEPQP